MQHVPEHEQRRILSKHKWHAVKFDKTPCATMRLLIWATGLNDRRILNMQSLHQKPWLCLDEVQ